MSRGSIVLIDAAAALLLVLISLTAVLYYSKLIFTDTSLLPHQVKKCLAQKIGATFLLETLKRAGHLALADDPSLFKKYLASALTDHPPPPGVELVLAVNGSSIAKWGDLGGSPVLATISMSFSTRQGLVKVMCYVGECAIESQR